MSVHGPGEDLALMALVPLILSGLNYVLTSKISTVYYCVHIVLQNTFAAGMGCG